MEGSAAAAAERRRGTARELCAHAHAGVCSLCPCTVSAYCVLTPLSVADDEGIAESGM